ncbi:hypothetical protein C8E05_7013 [Rhodococcus wratislaviensis]|uniref:Uncharacterized protein n=1 Tax=Rhodococcus wratislaviensis TaxID=44752 RepID=A0AB38F776_RHOWR|nr:hypothetical protein C8E05_7013 [Rhodococcus wratislaviensis]SPZ35404.1 Uncharacterised protein [Rhodococcus wratislaviensis]
MNDERRQVVEEMCIIDSKHHWWTCTMSRGQRGDHLTHPKPRIGTEMAYDVTECAKGYRLRRLGRSHPLRLHSTRRGDGEGLPRQPSLPHASRTGDHEAFDAVLSYERVGDQPQFLRTPHQGPLTCHGRPLRPRPDAMTRRLMSPHTAIDR